MHSLRWETLLHPTLGVPLALDQNNLLSRYVISNDSRFEPPLTKSSLSALIAVLLVGRLFKRKTRPGLAYDIVYAYTIIPFVLRALHIK